MKWRELLWWVLVPLALVVLAQWLSRRARAQRLARMKELYVEPEGAGTPKALLVKGRRYHVLHNLPSSGEPFREGEVVTYVGSIRLSGDDAIEYVFCNAADSCWRTLTIHGNDDDWRASFRELPEQGPPFV